jgi:hypothetical protein
MRGQRRSAQGSVPVPCCPMACAAAAASTAAWRQQPCACPPCPPPDPPRGAPPPCAARSGPRAPPHSGGSAACCTRPAGTQTAAWCSRRTRTAGQRPGRATCRPAGRVVCLGAEEASRGSGSHRARGARPAAAGPPCPVGARSACGRCLQGGQGPRARFCSALLPGRTWSLTPRYVVNRLISLMPTLTLGLDWCSTSARRARCGRTIRPAPARPGWRAAQREQLACFPSPSPQRSLRPLPAPGRLLAGTELKAHLSST